MENRVALRVDDVGSASKVNEVYGTTQLKLGNVTIPFPGNFLFLKYMKPFRKWGPYAELTVQQMETIFEYCESNKIKLTIGVTAGWVEKSGAVIDYPEKFSKQAELLKSAARKNLIEIANHGYTHCVLKDGVFRPKWFSGNRESHREFWDWIPAEVQEKHIAASQKILQNYFEAPVVTFVPPGNVFSEKTLPIAKRHGLKYLSCRGIDGKKIGELIPIPESSVIAFHDKELSEFGVAWFDSVRPQFNSRSLAFIREIGESLELRVAK